MKRITKNRIRLLEERLVGVIEEIGNAQRLTDWKFKTGGLDGGERIDLDDSSWGSVVASYQWPQASSGAWFRKKVVIPEKVCGIETSGSRADLALYLPSGGEVFVNQKVMAKDDSWLKLDFPIAEEIRPKETFLLAVRAKKGLGYPELCETYLFIEKVDAVLLRLKLFLNKLRFIQALGGWKKKNIYQQLLLKAVEEIDLDSLDKKHIGRFASSFHKADRILFPLSKEIKKHTIHLIGHAHIDMNWLWSWPTTLNTIKGTFGSVEDFFNQYPQFIFSQSQAAIYAAVEQHYPEIFRNIKRRVKEKRWEITASTWTEGDVNMANGESLVRQILYAKKYIREKFGVDPKVCWCPDTFGHPWTYPQILKKSGIDYYYAYRAKPSQEWPIFWWQSPDGSRVLAFNAGILYNNKVSPDICSELIYIKGRSKSNHHLVVYGVGNHGGGPTRRDLNNALRLQKEPSFPEIKFNTPEGFFQSALRQRKDYPIVNNELNPIFEGCYTTHADIKMMNRKGEVLLFNAEVFSSLVSLYGKPYPGKDLEKGWRNILFNQFHDILDGSGTHSSYNGSPQHALGLFREIEELANKALDDALQFICQRIPYSRAGKPVVIFNPLSWARKDIVKLKVGRKNEIRVCDENGQPVLSQTEGDELLFLAEVPSLGYRTYYLQEKNSPAVIDKKPVSVTEHGTVYRIETPFFSIRLDRESGTITNLLDKRIDREIVSSFYQSWDEARYNLAANTFQLLYERPKWQRAGDAWVIGPISRIENLISGAKVTLVEKGPVRAVLEVKHTFNRSSLTQQIVFYADCPKIDFFTTVDWQEKGDGKNDAPMLKVAFPFKISAEKACYEIPFGYIYRPTDGREAVALNWADISNKGYGVSLLNDCKYGYDISGGTIRLTLIRSAYSPDPAPDVGINRFAYCLYPHQNDWRKGKTVQAGYEFNMPLIPFYPGSACSKQDNKLPSSHSFLDIQPESLILSALKRAEDNQGLILRIYESRGKETQGRVTLNFPVSDFQEMNLMERGVAQRKKEGSKVTFKFGKNEIKTFRLTGTTDKN